jgi:hypothetical protein
MPEPSLLDVLKQIVSRQRLYRGALILAGLYLICAGILGLAGEAGSGLRASARLVLGAAFLAAARFVRATPSSVQVGQSGAGLGSRTRAREDALRSMFRGLTDWTVRNGLSIACCVVLAGSWCLQSHLAGAGFGLLLAGAGLVLFLGFVSRAEIDAACTSPAQEVSTDQRCETGVRWRIATGALALSLLTFFSLPENRLTLACSALWIASVVAWMAAFWKRPVRPGFDLQSAFLRLWRGEVELRLTCWLLLFLGILAVAAVFRFTHLTTVPGEMTSDHVEDLLSVNRILNEGERPIFDSANGGREPLAFYLAALTAHFAGTGLTHITLKIVSALAGFLTLPFIYLLAREVTDDALSGLLAMLTTGLAWWPNVLGRLGLRLSLTALFSAIALWLIIRAVRRSQPDAALMSGLATGVGMYACTPLWAIPLATALALFLAVLHDRRWASLCRLGKYWAMCTIVTLAVSAPMLRYRLEHLGDLQASIQTRVIGEYGQFSEPTVRSFLRNEWNSLRMFHWTSDGVWIVSPPGQPALDWVTAGLLLLGASFLLYRYLRSREWLDLYLLLSIPVLLLPSTMALAFEGRENPSLQRSSAAIPVLFTVTGIALALPAEPLRRFSAKRGAEAVAIGYLATALGISAWANSRIVFRDYAGNYAGAAQNASGIGRTIHDFANSVGSFETAFVKGYPNWVDVRAVGIYAGKFGWEQAVCDSCQFRDAGVITDDERSKLFILHPMDQAFLKQLREIYPGGGIRAEGARAPHQEFLIYFVPGRIDARGYRLPPP